MAWRAVALCALYAALPKQADAFAPAVSVGRSLSLQAPSVSAFKGPVKARAPRGVRLAMQEKKGFEISPWLRFDTRGGALVWTGILIVLPFFIYGPLAEVVGDELQAGRLIAGVYMVGVCLVWTFTYVFRVGNKDMTYSKQLKAYEDAVIAKRFEELQEDEVDALMTSLDDPVVPDPDDKTPKIKGSGWRPDQY